jgi:hypothetical protein
MTVTNPFLWQGMHNVYLAYTGSHYMLLTPQLCGVAKDRKEHVTGPGNFN